MEKLLQTEGGSGENKPVTGISYMIYPLQYIAKESVLQDLC